MANKTKANVQYEVGVPIQNQAMIWDGVEWVLTNSPFVVSGNDISGFYTGTMYLGDVGTPPQTVITPRRDSSKGIGSNFAKFFEFFIRKIFVYDQLFFVEFSTPEQVVKGSLKIENDKLTYKNGAGVSKIALLPDGDIELFKA